MSEERILIDGVKYKLWVPEDEVREFEPIVVEHISNILGSENAIFFTKQKIRTPRGIGSIPDGFAIVLGNTPHWYVIEVELSRHSPYDHAEPQAKKFKKAIQSSETRKQLVDAMYDEVKSDIIKEKLIKDKISSGEIHKFLSDLITIDNLTLLIVLEEVAEDWREAFDDFPDVKIVKFKTFKREDAPTVHAHLYKPLFETLPNNEKPGESSEWTKDELFEFLGYRTDIQREFLKTLAEKDKVYNDDLLVELKRKLRDKFGGYTRGALGGLNRAIDLAGKELLHYSDWDEQGRFYKIESKYRDIIKRYFSQQE